MKTTLPLHELTGEFLALEAALIESGGEITPAMEAAFAILEPMETDKIRGYVSVILRMEATAAGVKHELDRLKRFHDTMKNGAKGLKDRLKNHMELTGKTEYETTLGRVKVMNAGGKPPVILLVQPEDLPDRFKKVTVEPNKTALLEALQLGDGDAVQVAEIGDRGTYLRIF